MAFFFFLHSLNIQYFFFFWKATQKEDQALFCLELYQEMLTILENYITDSNAMSCIWWPIKMINERQHHILLVVAL